jgi:hypothetical protein
VRRVRKLMDYIRLDEGLAKEEQKDWQRWSPVQANMSEGLENASFSGPPERKVESRGKTNVVIFRNPRKEDEVKKYVPCFYRELSSTPFRV